MTPATAPAPLDLSPAGAGGPASPHGRASRAARQGLVEVRLQVRNGEQLLLSLLIPVAVLVVGRFFAGGLISFAELAPSVLALALWSSGFTAPAIATGFERQYGVLERLAATPLRRSGLIAGKTLGVALIATGQLVVLGALALALGWRPAAGVAGTVVVALTSLGAMASFVAAALVMAGRLRAEITLALANVCHLVFAAAGGILMPARWWPEPVTVAVSLLPTGALGEAWRQFSVGATATGGIGEAWLFGWWPVAVVAAWAAGLTVLASKGFRWLA